MTWIPRSPLERHGELIWLPRLLDKARRVLEGRQQGVDLLTPYMFGNYDYLDAKLFAFLKIRDTDVLQAVADHLDDAGAAMALLARRNPSDEECRRWSMKFRSSEALWIYLIECDEGRRTGRWARFATWFLNDVFIPPVFWVYRLMESRRSPGTEAPPSPAAD